MNAADLLARLDDVKGSGPWTACCPAHEDGTPSLSVTEAADKILLKCHAGCTAEAIVAVLGIELRDLFHENGTGHGRDEILAEYDYTNADGTLLFQVVRFPPKEFRQRRPDGAGGWTWNLKGVDRVLYRLPQVLEAVEAGKRVFLVEGEKDVHSVEAAGYVATTCPGGAGKWRPAYTDTLKGADVVIVADADEPGYRHAAEVAKALKGVARKVVIVEPAEGKDVSDHLAAGKALADLVPVPLERLRSQPSPPKAPSGSNKAGIAVTRRLSDVPPERVAWLWPGRIPLGRVTVVEGDPGLGKSTVTLDLAARLSVGGQTPDGHQLDAAGTVLLTAEDGLADTVRPRVDAAGGDPTRVYAVVAVRHEDREDPIELPDHVDTLRAVIAETGARLVLVDPLMAFVGGSVNTWRDHDVRRALRPLHALAEETGVAIVVIRHLTKAPGGRAIRRGGGSIGIVGAARSALLVARDPDDDTRRVLAVVKANLAAEAPSLRYRVEGHPNGAGRIMWEGTSQHSADRLVAEPVDEDERTAVDEAVAFLEDVLGAGPQPVEEVRREARKAGHADRTLDRAKARRGVRSQREGGVAGLGRWVWSLPKDTIYTPRGGVSEKPQKTGVPANAAKAEIIEDAALLAELEDLARGRPDLTPDDLLARYPHRRAEVRAWLDARGGT